jgi:glycolate oxidase FAD binding subunit
MTITGAFVAEIGVGVVHRSDLAQPRKADAAIAALHKRLKREFDPTLRLNPGVEPLSA